MILRAVLVPSLLALACLAPGADLMWSGAPGAKPPAGWSVVAGAETTVTFAEQAIEITALSGRQALAVAAVVLPDGSDEKPMRLSALVSAQGKAAVDGYPALVALEWGGGAVFAVGLGDDPHSKKDERRAWAVWSGNGKLGSDHAEAELAAGASPAHVRIILTAREVAAYGSRDGWTWNRIAGVRREALGASGAPARVVVGRGVVRSGAAGLAADPPGAVKGTPCTYRFADLRLETGQAEVPASALKSYAKKDSLADTVDALVAIGVPTLWRIRGPEDGGKATLPVVLPAGFTGGEGWKEHKLGETERFVQLGKLLPGGNSQVRWAATTVSASEAGWMRFRFDGIRLCWLWVDGRLISAPIREVGEAEADRLSAAAWLTPGNHEVILAVRSNDGRAAITLRHEPGDPRARIALLRRLSIDFAGDEQLIDAPFEIARLWEGLGFAREAATALAEVVGADPDLAERALAERARLYHQLGDEAAATAETTALQRLWSAGNADEVAAARRTARLWQRLEVPERALGILGEALKLPGLDGVTRCSLIVDRARLRRTVGEEPAVAAELRAAAEQLPVGDGARFDLLCAAGRIDPALPKTALDDLGRLASDALRARQLAGLHAARKDESSRIIARRLAATLPGTALAMPAIELAEDHALAKDEAGALKLYQQELARRSLPAVSDLAGARSALVRAVLAETQAGSTLLAESGRLPPAAVQPLAWMVRGPVPLGDWTPHEKPAFDAAQAPAGKEWRPVTGDQWVNGVLDHSKVGGGDNIVYYLATVISSDSVRNVSASCGADDGLSVWLNGERLYSDRSQRGLVPDSIVLTLNLRPGANVLLCAVQNGGGPSAFQFRMRREPWPASDLAVALAGVSGDRAASSQILADLARTLLTAERTDEAWALARTAVACWPEQTGLIRDLAGAAISQPQVWKTTPTALLELTGWFDAALADRRWDDAETRHWIQEYAPGQLLGAGLVDEALARLRRQVLTELDARAVAMAHLREADIWLGMGFPRAGTAAVQRARDAAPGEETVEREADKRRRSIRGSKGDQIAFATPFELNALLRTAERALANDPERAAKDFQAVIEGPSDQPILLAGGRLRGAATFAAASLRGAKAEVRQIWLEANGERATTALTRVVADDPAALAAVSGRWPLAPAAGEALRREADLWAERGAWQLAAGTAARCLAEHPGENQGRLLLRAAQASARLGDSATLDGLLAKLAKLAKVPAWDGRQLPAEQLAAALRALLPPVVAVADPERIGVEVRFAAYAPALRPETAADARPPLPAAAIADGLLLVATPDDLVGIAPDGTLRWQLAAGRDGGMRGPELAIAGESALAVDGGVAVAGLRRFGLRRLVAAATASGRQLWSSADIPDLARATLASAPTIAGGRVWAWFVEANRGFVACLDARDGTVQWRSTLGTGPVRQPLARGGDYFASGSCPAPALRGRELFVTTDAGQVGAFDAVDGRLIWLHLYLRTALDPEGGRSAYRRLLARGRGQVLVDAERVYLAPRDSLGILALDRVSGAQAWAAELVDVQELVALTPAGLVALGSAVTLHQPSNGALRWRWRPASGERPGLPALAGDALWIPLRSGPLRLALADGGIRRGPTWSELGLATVPGGLLAAGGRLLALADGLVAMPVPGAAKTAAVTIRAGGKVQPVASGATPAGAAAPSGLAVNWELPVGHVSKLWDLDNGEVCLIAGDRLHKVEAATGRIVWTAVAPAGNLRSCTYEATSLLLVSDGVVAVYDRANGRLRWSEAFFRDPVSRVLWWDPWNVQAILAGGVVMRWNMGDGRFQVRDASDGAVRCAAASDAPIWNFLVAGDELHLLCVRGKDLVMDVRSLKDGKRIKEVPLGITGVDKGSLCRLPGGDAVIGSRAGGALWNAAKREATRIDLDMEWIHRAVRDGDTLVLAGQTDHRFRAAFLDAAGKNLGQDEFVHHGTWPERVAWAPRITAGLRVQMANRAGQTGFLVRTLEGGEKAWLPLREEWRRHNYGILPLGGKALAFSSDKDGWLRVQMLDPQAGKVEIDAAFGLTMVGGVQPVASAGAALVPTTRGLVSLVPVAGPAPLLPGRALGDSHQAVWRLLKQLVVDGRLDEWEGQAGWEQDPVQAGRGGAPALGEPLQAWAAWRDDAVALAISIPLPPAAAPSTVVALDSVRGDFIWNGMPLMLSLDWQDGEGRVRMLHRPVLDDPARAPLQARAASDGTNLNWEILVPWTWMYPAGERPGRDHWLRWGALVDPGLPGGGAYELGSGLFPAFDKAGLTRLRLVDVKPGPDEKPPKGVVPKKGVEKKKK